MTISNGFKKGRFYSHLACTDDGCLNTVCSLGHICKCFLHKKLSAILTALCFDVLSNGNRAKSCIYAAEQRKKNLDKGCVMCNGSNVSTTYYNCSNPLHRHCSNSCMALTQCVRTEEQKEKIVGIEIMLLALSSILILTFAFFLSYFPLAPKAANKRLTECQGILGTLEEEIG